MSSSLNNVTTQAQYDGARTLICPATRRLDLQVANAAIYYQIGVGSPPAYDEPETFASPGGYSLDRVTDAVRVRSALASAPAQVTIQAMAAGELA